MEYVSKINIFDLKMMVKKGLEKIILKFLLAQKGGRILVDIKGEFSWTK